MKQQVVITKSVVGWFCVKDVEGNLILNIGLMYLRNIFLKLVLT